MINTVLAYVLIFPILVVSCITIGMAVFGIFAVLFVLKTGRYTYINKLDDWFASESTAYSLSMLTIAFLGIMFIAYVFGFIDSTVVSVFIGVALYPSLWYLIYLMDVWYNNYKQYKTTKGRKS